MRPLGAIVFGEIGDRIVGRKYALVFSILLITIPSVLMGILPGYNTWGWISPILLVLLRMLQGLSVGGQLAGSYVLSIEQSSSTNRGFRGSICDASSVSSTYKLIPVPHEIGLLGWVFILLVCFWKKERERDLTFCDSFYRFLLLNVSALSTIGWWFFISICSNIYCKMCINRRTD